MKRILIILFLILLFSASVLALENNQKYSEKQLVFYVGVHGTDTISSGSLEQPFASVDYASLHVPDGATIKVLNGVYHHFSVYYGYNQEKNNYLTIEPVEPGKVTFILSNPADIVANHVIIRGFTFSHLNQNVQPLLMQIRKKQTHHIIIENNYFNGSFNNDLLKVHSNAHNIVIRNNSFKNQSNSDEMIDLNGVEDVLVYGNSFFNDFNDNDSRINNCNSFIVVKDSSSFFPNTGSNNIQIINNDFNSYYCNQHHGFVKLGEDGRQSFESSNVIISNNRFNVSSSSRMAFVISAQGVNGLTVNNNFFSGVNFNLVSIFAFDKYNKNAVSKNILITANYFLIKNIPLVKYWNSSLEQDLNLGGLVNDNFFTVERGKLSTFQPRDLNILDGNSWSAVIRMSGTGRSR